jgi:hypothetical protein
VLLLRIKVANFHECFNCNFPKIAIYCLGKDDEAKRWLLEAMRIALPHGFITPFVETVTTLGGLIEQCLEREFPAYRRAVLEQWEHTLILSILLDTFFSNNLWFLRWNIMGWSVAKSHYIPAHRLTPIVTLF